MIERVDWSKLELYMKEQEAPRRRAAPMSGLSYRCPREISASTSLRIDRSTKCHHENHYMVKINGIDLCPVSAIMFMIAAKNYRWSDQLGSAINKVIEEAF